MSNSEGSDVLAHVAANLRRLRAAAGLSQSVLAERAGMSRRTIIKLEAGEANISLSGLDQLAEALDVSFVDLVASPTALRTHVNAVAWRGPAPESVAVLRGSIPAASEAQLWTWVLAVRDRYDALPDAVGWHEMVYVTEGVLRIDREDGTSHLAAGDHLVYSSAQHYSYVNAGETPARFIRVVVG